MRKYASVGTLSRFKGNMGILVGDCLEKMREMDACSVDAIVTDPPYAFGFMGKKWDYELPSVEIWKEALRILKPGGHALVFGGPRTYHRMACAVEDAGFEVRDQLQWLFGSGFPKSLDISKAIDKAAGAEREVISKTASAYKVKGLSTDNSHDGYKRPSHENWEKDEKGYRMDVVTAPATLEAKTWSGWGTALKPANEPILLARKPLSEKTVAANVLKWNTGGLNIDAGRIEAGNSDLNGGAYRGTRLHNNQMFKGLDGTGNAYVKPQGRFPANLLLDETAAEMLDAQSGELKSGAPGIRRKNHETTSMAGRLGVTGQTETGFGDTGGASRFFYVAKASKSERNRGLEGMPEREGPGSKRSTPAEGRASALGAPRANHHPTVKPIKLMSYLIRLITPPGGLVLDPFAGSGSTGVAALKDGFRFIGIEREAEYAEIAQKRLDNAVV